MANPYLMQPVEGGNFVGRTSDYEKFQRYIREKPSIILVEGERGIGKTSFIRNLLHQEFCEPKPFFIKYRIKKELDHGFLLPDLYKRLEEESGTRLEKLKSLMKKLDALKMTFKVSLQNLSLEIEKPPGAFSRPPDIVEFNYRTIEDIQDFLEKMDILVVVLVEDAHNLSVSEQRILDTIVSNSSNFFAVLEIPSVEYDKMVIRDYKPICLKRLSEEDSMEIIKKENFLNKEISEAIYKISYGNPYYIQSICWLLYEKYLEEGKIGIPLFIETLKKEELEKRQNIIHREILDVLGSESRQLLMDLSIAPYVLTQKIINVFSSIGDVDSAQSILKKKRLLLERDGTFWIYHSLFREFLRSEQENKIAIGLEDIFLKAVEGLKKEEDCILLLYEMREKGDTLQRMISRIENESVLLNFGHEEYDSGKWETAKLCYETGVDLDGKLKSQFIQSIGIIFYSMGNLDEALKYYEKALEIYKGKGDKKGKADILGAIGLVHRDKGNLNETLNYLERALEIHKEIGDKKGEAIQLGNMAAAYGDKGDLDKALEFSNQALRLNRKTGFREGEADNLGTMGVIYKEKGYLKRGLKFYSEAQGIYKEIGYKQKEMTQIGNMGSIHRSWGELDKALECFNQALEASKEIGDKKGVASQLENIGLIYSDKGELDEALVHFNKALEINKEIGYKQGEANNLTNIGFIHINEGELDKALECSKKALKIARETGHIQQEASALGNVGLVYRARGELDEALKYSKKALEIAKETGYKKIETYQFGNIGLIYDDKGELDEALKYFKKTLEIAKETGYKQDEAKALEDIGLICKERGELDKSLKYLKNALEINREIGQRQREAGNLAHIGDIYGNKEIWDEALRYSKEALEIAKEIDYKKGEANRLENLGLIYRAKGELDKALECFEQALEVDKKIGYKQGEAIDLENIGLIYREKREFNESLIYHEEALKIHRKVGYKQGEASQLAYMGLISREMGELDEALKLFEQALEIDKEIGYKQGEAIRLANIGLIYSEKGELDKALDRLKEALEIFASAGEYPELLQIYLNLFGISLKKDKPYEAFSYIRDALSSVPGEENALRVLRSLIMIIDKLIREENWEYLQHISALKNPNFGQNLNSFVEAIESLSKYRISGKSELFEKYKKKREELNQGFLRILDDLLKGKVI